MERLFFKCKVCNRPIEMKKDVYGSFSDWAYGCVEWSDFDEHVPVLSERCWVRSELTPEAGKSRTVFVQKPFDEEIGNEFFALYEPALLHLNGWFRHAEAEMDKCAIVRCRFEKILISDEYSAWIRVHVQEVIFLHELYRHYKETKTEVPIDTFEGIPKSEYERDFKNDRWYITSWTAQGDCGEIKWIYTGEENVRHLVMQRWYAFDEDVLYIGNIREIRKF